MLTLGGKLVSDHSNGMLLLSISGTVLNVGKLEVLSRKSQTETLLTEHLG